MDQHPKRGLCRLGLVDRDVPVAAPILSCDVYQRTERL